MEPNKSIDLKNACRKYIEGCVSQLPDERELKNDLSQEMQNKIFMEALGVPYKEKAASERKKRFRVAVVLAALLAALIAFMIFAAAVTRYTSNGSVIEFGREYAVIYPVDAQADFEPQQLSEMPEIIPPQGYEKNFHRGFIDGSFEEGFSCGEDSIEVSVVRSRSAVIVVDYNGGVRVLHHGADDLFVWEKGEQTYLILLDGERILRISGNVGEDEIIGFADLQI